MSCSSSTAWRVARSVSTCLALIGSAIASVTLGRMLKGLFGLRDAMLAGNARRALTILQGLRAEGEALHKAGNHSESVKVLGEALKLLEASE